MEIDKHFTTVSREIMRGGFIVNLAKQLTIFSQHISSTVFL
jgi:hypothetical protein